VVPVAAPAVDPEPPVCGRRSEGARHLRNSPRENPPVCRRDRGKESRAGGGARYGWLPHVCPLVRKTQTTCYNSFVKL
ncbi:MAG: hypothetical protein AVDCRST_MAG28-1170, partial [uncultured Rubrobacteraceae bacterium]